MAKYDEFGRPIYETAEEYNKAHRTGKNTYSYDTPKQEAYQSNKMKNPNHYQGTAGQHVNQTGMKKQKSVAVGFVVCIIAFCVGMVIAMFNVVRTPVGDRHPQIEEEWVESATAIVDDTDPLPEGFETFSYNGQSYTLPTTLEEILQMGFTLEPVYNVNDMIPTEYEEMLILNGADGFMAAMIRINNYSGEEIPLGKCMVDYFYIENPSVRDETAFVPYFVFGAGLTFKSSYEDLEEYFGLPSYHYEDYSEEDSCYDIYEWAYYGGDEVHFVSITFWNGVMSDVGIEKKAYEKSIKFQ